MAIASHPSRRWVLPPSPPLYRDHSSIRSRRGDILCCNALPSLSVAPLPAKRYRLLSRGTLHPACGNLVRCDRAYSPRPLRYSRRNFDDRKGQDNRRTIPTATEIHLTLVAQFLSAEG